MVSANARRVLAGPATAGALFPIEPVRVYDSRLPTPAPGKLDAGTNRVIYVGDGGNLSTGAVDAPNVVPAGATAVVFNLSVINTDGSGFMTVTPGSAVTYKASTVNWVGADAKVNSASVVGVNGSRQVKVFNGAPAPPT